MERELQDIVASVKFYIELEKESGMQEFFSSQKAVMQDGLQGLIHQANDALHLLSAGAWLGALVPLAVILLRAHTGPLPPDSSTALRRFSVTGHLAVATVLATGATNMVFVLGWPSQWTTPYQSLLAAKIALVLTMVGLAVINRYVFVPALKRDPERAMRSLLCGTLAEITLGTVVVFLVAVFGTLDPG